MQVAPTTSSQGVQRSISRDQPARYHALLHNICVHNRGEQACVMHDCTTFCVVCAKLKYPKCAAHAHMLQRS